MGNRCVDRSGMVYGELKVSGRDLNSGGGKSLWLCECSCGNVRSVRSGNLVSGRARSCHKCPVNTYMVVGNTAIGKTRKGLEFTIDKEYLDMARNYTWNIDCNGYVTSTVGKDTISLHRLVMGPSGKLIDHIDQDKTNNTKANLRIASSSLNSFNAGIRPTNTSGYPGVCWHKGECKWRVQINANGKRHNLGSFKDINVAIGVRREAELHYHGEYALKTPEPLPKEAT